MIARGRRSIPESKHPSPVATLVKERLIVPNDDGPPKKRREPPTQNKSLLSLKGLRELRPERFPPRLFKLIGSILQRFIYYNNLSLLAKN